MKVYNIPEGRTVRLSVVSNKDFSPVFGKASNFEVGFFKTQRLNSLINGHPTLFYVDLALWEDEKSAMKAITSVLKDDSTRVGVIDSKGNSKDPAQYFQLGCVDFLPPPVLRERITATRYRRVLALAPFREENYDVSDSKEENLYSSKGWKGIRQGKEYIFGFMFVELDNILELQNVLGSSGCRKFSVDLRDHLSDYLSIWDGYVWIWTDFGGAILFPFDGFHYRALEAGIELVVNQECIRFSSVEREATFRVALHLGQTRFSRRGNTGDIVSDSVNSLFHLGHHFTSPASLHLTEDIRPFIPQSLESYFVSMGEFEGREIFKLKDRA